MAIERSCVSCGSSPGAGTAYVQAARDLAATLLERDVGLVYGGGSVGLMGEVADAVLRGGGTVVGVLPKALDRREVAHRGLTELHVVGSMHERKAARHPRQAGRAPRRPRSPGAISSGSSTTRSATGPRAARARQGRRVGVARLGRAARAPLRPVRLAGGLGLAALRQPGARAPTRTGRERP